MKLADLQKKLKPAKLDGYLVTRNNMFLNQDVRNDENLVRLLTGFTGSHQRLFFSPLAGSEHARPYPFPPGHQSLVSDPNGKGSSVRQLYLRFCRA